MSSTTRSSNCRCGVSSPALTKIAIEGSDVDRPIGSATWPPRSHDVRLSIAGTSELQSPIRPSADAAAASSALSDGVKDRDGQVNLYLPDLDRGAVGSALSVLADMARQIGPMKTLVVHLEPPERDDAPAW